jgi:hypothetical protein
MQVAKGAGRQKKEFIDVWFSSSIKGAICDCGLKSGRSAQETRFWQKM